MKEAGAAAWGVARAEAVDPAAAEAYDRWIAEGRHGEMAYLERYRDIRRDPRLLLDGARSVIVAAFPYAPPQEGCRVAAYALGDDYHHALRTRLLPTAEYLEGQGYKARMCVDTAPIRERLWAVKAGVGFIGRNGMLIVPGAGSYIFLAEIITDAPLDPSEPCPLSCLGCEACVKACPGGALNGHTIDCRRCISYLTIEYRGEQLPADANLGGRLYGCDACQRVCPHNRQWSAEPLAEFSPRPDAAGLTPDQAIALTPGDYRRLTRGSAMARAKLDMLRRNAAHAMKTESNLKSKIENRKSKN